jgi:glucose-6-phosphate 1-dehydrogenase
VVTYEPNSWGPVESDTLLEDDGRVWRMRCGTESAG